MSIKNMQMEVHRAGKTFYAHNTVLLNQPGRDLERFLSTNQWQAVAGAMFLDLVEVRGRRLSDYASQSQGAQALAAPPGLTEADRTRMRAQGVSDEMLAQFEQMTAQLNVGRAQAAQSSQPTGLAALLERRTGVPWAVWERSGQELLEALMPRQSGNVSELMLGAGGDASAQRKGAAARRLGLAGVTLATDFPITSATFGFSRVDYSPDQCRLNPFPPDPEHGGRFPIFVDVVEADAILLRLDHHVVLSWLRANGIVPSIPAGEDPDLSSRGYFISLMDDVALRQTIPARQREARMVFGLLHTLSHLTVKRAALLCGLDGTSLSEYLLPRSLTFAIYCNHRFGATIGALSALFEQSIEEWLGAIRDSRRCVYDPVCIGAGGVCHACVHLAETGCRFFNVNLGRSFLFGGSDSILGDIRQGFFDAVRPG